MRCNYNWKRNIVWLARISFSSSSINKALHVHGVSFQFVCLLLLDFYRQIWFALIQFEISCENLHFIAFSVDIFISLRIWIVTSTLMSDIRVFLLLLPAAIFGMLNIEQECEFRKTFPAWFIRSFKCTHIQYHTITTTRIARKETFWNVKHLIWSSDKHFWFENVDWRKEGAAAAQALPKPRNLRRKKQQKRNNRFDFIAKTDFN